MTLGSTILRAETAAIAALAAAAAIPWIDREEMRFTRINTKGNAFALPSRVAFSVESYYFFFATFFAAFFTAFFAAFFVAMTILPLNNLGCNYNVNVAIE